MPLQEHLRDIDAGTKGRIILISMFVMLIAALVIFYSLFRFKGLGTEAAMDQAQIARSLASGEGFTTRYIRPLAIQQLLDADKKIPANNFPECKNSPLFPLVESALLFPLKGKLNMSPSETISTGDRAIAFLGIALMLLGVLVWYFTGRLLFDQTLAVLGAGLLMVTDLMWQYALAGLPQHLLIIFFGLATYCAVQAHKHEESDEIRPMLLWLGGAGLMFGLMALTHGVTVFLLPGFMAFCLLGFRDRIIALAVPVGVFLVIVAPWMIHNFFACGNPFGISIYIALAGAGVTEEAVMRGVNVGLNLGGGMPTKFRTSFMDQAAHLWEYLGLNLVVIAALVSVMHPFRNPTTALWRWIVVMMWVGAAIGMALFGVKETISGNQLHIIFLPIFVLYGMAFILILWNRLNVSLPQLRIAFLTIVFFIAAVPMLLTLIVPPQGGIQWPPYVPPFISVLRTWFKPKELLCSDMPWAVAWYANRKCLLLPETVHQFTEISDYTTLGEPISGLYLTPVSGQHDFISLIKGPYKDWGPVIMRTQNLNDFLLKSFSPLPIDGECILYADSERWRQKSK